MPINADDPVTQQQRYRKLYEEEKQDQQLKPTLDPNVAKRLSEIYRDAPYIPAAVALSMAKAGTSPEAVNGIKKVAAQKTAKDLEPNKPKKKGLFQELVYDNVKAASRWSFAGLSLVPDLIQNAASQVFSENNPEGFDGWFKSTQFGTLMSNTADAGEGFFLGETAMKNQATRAREFRGTINNSAWTVGRGAADIAFTPGSKAYSLMSGFIDAAVNIYGDPTLVAGQAVQAAKAGGKVSKALPGTKKATQILADQLLDKDIVASRIIPGLGSAEDIENARLLAKGEAGLDSAEGMAFQASKFGKWVLSDKRAQRLTARIVEVASDTTKSVQEKTIFMLENIQGLDPATAKAFAEADETGKVLGLLGTASARLTTNAADVLLPTNISDIRLSKRSNELLTKFDGFMEDSLKERSPLYRNIRHSRWFETLPKGQVVVRGSGADKTEAIKTYARYLRGVKLGDETPEFKMIMAKVVDAYSSTDPTTARASVKEAYNETLRAVAKQGFTGEKAEAASELAEEMIKQADLAKSKVYSINSVGETDDGGALAAIQSLIPEGVFDDIPLDVRERMVANGPGALNELIDDVLVLPDYRRMRALAGNPFITRKSAYRVKDVKKLAKGSSLKEISGEAVTRQTIGEQRKAAVVAEFVQQEIWKPLALASGGYVMRNMLDAQTRIALSGKSGLFRHPQDFILWALRKKGGFDITGKDFGGILAKNWKKEQTQFWEGLTFDVHKNIKDIAGAERRTWKNGSFSIVNRSSPGAAHTIGYVDNLALINEDRMLSQVARLSLQGLDRPTRVQRITDWIMSPENKEFLGQLRNYFEEGVPWVDPDDTSRMGRIPIPKENIDEAIPIWIDRMSEMKVGVIVKDNEDLRVVAGYNRVPLTQKLDDGRTVTLGPETINRDDILPEQLISGDGGVGSVIRMDDGAEGVIIRETSTSTGIDPFTGEPSSRMDFVVQPVHNGPAFSAEGLGTKNLRDVIDSKADDQLAEFVKRAERGAPGTETGGSKFLQAKDTAVDFFFVSLYGRATQFLEKSPVFRQFYYEEVFNQADLLAPTEAAALLARAKVSAKEAGVSLKNYMGGKNVVDRLEEVASSTSDAIGTVAQLDDFAKATSLRQTKELLYNATEKSNLEDVMRIIVPFGSAWKEVLGTYARNVVEDPTRLRKAQLIFDGGRKFDPDNDGEGFFYRDPTTGEYSFNFPFSGAISQLLTGQDVALQAPVKRLSIGLGVIPSIGPMAQVAASQIIPDTPKADWITSILLPYGKKESVTIMPMWAKRAMEAWQGNTQNLQTVYGNTYIETLRALSASGEYDLADFDDKEQLFVDARNKARILTGLRALGQFLGPTSPSPEFTIDTIQGDVYGTQLVKEFQKLQATNYDTAVSEFLRIYGNDALLYISNKTESVAGGLEATDDFGDWERTEGKGLISKYSDVAGFMAPGGDDFSFEVWSRQLAKGLRRRLTDREIVELAQYRAASARYRALRDQLPPRPSSEQKRWLRQWRVQLNKEYPGFPVVAEFNPGEFPGKIQQLTRMVQDPQLADNDVAEATRQYLTARESAVSRYVQSGGAEGGFATAAATEPLRDWLAGVGKALKQQTPEFARLYDRLLSNEVEE
jgi:hypothetical protein